MEFRDEHEQMEEPAARRRHRRSPLGHAAPRTKNGRCSRQLCVACRAAWGEGCATYAPWDEMRLATRFSTNWKRRGWSENMSVLWRGFQPAPWQ